MTTHPPTVGMVGAGQLARMTHQAAIPFGLRLRLLAGRPDDSAAQVCREVSVGSPSHLEDLATFAKGCDVVTFDHELVPPDHLQALVERGATLRPSPEAMRFAQDKAHQRATFARLGLPVPPFATAAGADDVRRFGDRHGYPLVLKAARGGYDGRGVWFVDAAADVERRWEQAGGGTGLLVEAAVPLEHELAVVLARRPAGDLTSYPVVETVQRDGICTELAVPAPMPAAVAEEARRLGARVADAIDAVGVLAVELFWTGDRLLVNEVATRPHNSGHWTIDGAVTSQFANHLRAVLDWPLGSTALTAPAVATVNVLGPPDGSDPRTRVATALAMSGVHVHLYGKEARPGRKVGHVTATGDDLDETRGRARLAAALLTGSGQR